MISDTKRPATSEFQQNDIVSPKVLELRKKIHDDEYLENAIQRIAQVLSNKLVENVGPVRLRN